MAVAGGNPSSNSWGGDTGLGIKPLTGHPVGIRVKVRVLQHANGLKAQKFTIAAPLGGYLGQFFVVVNIVRQVLELLGSETTQSSPR